MPDHILGALRSSPTLALLSLGREWKSRFASGLASLELTPRQFAVLCDLWESPGLSPYDVVSAHARATAIIMDDPDADFAAAAVEARRLVAQRALPSEE